MNMEAALRAYRPYNIQEEKDKETILSFLERYDDAYERSNELAHMTASAWVVNPDKTKVLMAYHRIYDSWAWLGGHCD
ncbi:MAG: NUDIX hydrolase, partial [Erysipelotrichaceae bacterium]|nr:NUDIX hydrolase [Erysipelotrichaceae bacterium]